MSVFQYPVAAALPVYAKITSSTAVVIVDATDEAFFVPTFRVSENSGSAPNLTVEIYDGTTSYYLGAGGVTWKAKAVTAYQSLLFDDGYLVPYGSVLRVTSSDAAGKFDVTGLKGQASRHAQ